MLSQPHQLFGQAFNMRYAIGAFNVSNLELAQAVIGAAEAQKSPVIAQTSEGAIEYAGLPMIAAIIKTLAAEVSVPVVMHLDHGKSLELVKQCIEVGYTSVMIDASTKPFEENIALTKSVVEYAHDHGVWVEAELGAIVGKEGIKDLHGQQTPDSFFTKPADAAQFAQETGIDALAVSIGTIHGAFTGQEYIRFELLEAIEKVVPHLPLVVHGASGIASEHLQQVATTNVCKINIDTELRIAFERAVAAYFKEPHDMVDPRKILGPAREAVQQVVSEKMNLFGSTKKAVV